MRQHAPENRKGRGGLLVQLLKGRARQPLQILGEMKGRVVGHFGGLWMTRLLSARGGIRYRVDYRIICESPACSVGLEARKDMEVVEREVSGCYVEDASAHHRIIGRLR